MKEKYLQTETKIPSILVTIAKTGFDINISNNILQQWTIIASACMMIDHKMDELDSFDHRQRFAKRGIDYVTGITDNFNSDNHLLIEKIDQLRNVIQDLPKKQREQFAHDLRLYAQITEKIRNETNPKRASMLTMVEGQISSRLYFYVLPDNILHHVNLPKYQNTIKIVTRVANNLDTFFDLPDDYEKGITALEPTLSNRFYFFRDALCEGLSVIGYIKPEVLKQIVSFIIRNYKRRKGDFSQL